MTPPRKQIIDGTLVCAKCSEIKPEAEFMPTKRMTSGRLSWCDPCRREYNREYNREYRKTRATTPRRREWEWERRGIIGMTVERYNEMLHEQNMCCAICGANAMDLPKALCVDHDHATGEVRGLLCRSCNVAIGHLKDSLELVHRAANYLALYLKVEV